MARIFGFFVGLLWLAFASAAFIRSAHGWSSGASDIGLWFAVVGVFLTIAAGAAFVGTYLHTRPKHGS